MGSDDSEFSKILKEGYLEQQQKLSEERAKRDAEPYRVPSLVSTTDENYGLCISPSDALATFKLSTDALAVTQLHREIRSGRVQAVCHEAITFLNGIKERFEHVVIGDWLWHLETPELESDFWETGYFRVLIPKTIGRSNYQGDIEFFGVRFRPDGLPGGVENPISPSGAKSTSDQLPPLPSAEAERLARAIIEIWGNEVTESGPWS